jgi:predicted ATPase with chaperone activity
MTITPFLVADNASANGFTHSAVTSFIPRPPRTLEETGQRAEDIEKLICKLLASRGSLNGRQIAEHLGLPFSLLEGLYGSLKSNMVLLQKNNAPIHDFEYALTEMGRARAHQYSEACTYFGAVPVTLEQYVESVKAQSIAGQQVVQHQLEAAFDDLLVSPRMLRRLGPAVNSGRGIFLYGNPGNGKSSIAERITRCFGTNIWVPRAISIDGQIVRVFDPQNHVELKDDKSISAVEGTRDRRWVQIHRPTIMVGGELTMAELEIRYNPQTRFSEAPLQLKSNCGTLVIDDFGRQRISTVELLNRWILPLEKRVDFLSLPNGKKIQVPFDQLLIFATNLEPKDLVDEAFLRRIPYKIEVPDPTIDEFRALFAMMAPKLGFISNPTVVEDLIQRHYLAERRSFRSCHPRDLLLQVRSLCLYQSRQLELTPELFDEAVENYFAKPRLTQSNRD